MPCFLPPVLLLSRSCSLAFSVYSSQFLLASLDHVDTPRFIWMYMMLLCCHRCSPLNCETCHQSPSGSFWISFLAHHVVLYLYTVMPLFSLSAHAVFFRAATARPHTAIKTTSPSFSSPFAFPSATATSIGSAHSQLGSLSHPVSKSFVPLRFVFKGEWKRPCLRWSSRDGSCHDGYFPFFTLFRQHVVLRCVLERRSRRAHCLLASGRHCERPTGAFCEHCASQARTRIAAIR